MIGLLTKIDRLPVKPAMTVCIPPRASKRPILDAHRSHFLMAVVGAKPSA
jgi:hypothetical protein